ncbi:MAG TPA: F0F1 ATP synthase subunit B [Candidatus Saccharimonadales bacterium]|jgi:F-type H+-transporting ATPase subunit b|nr:F0F1 ATP synthase subunit B [Candidatus Saccharimonadales bacterium]
MVILTNLIFANSSGIGALGFSLSSFLIQLGSFLIVFLILKRFAFKPIIKLLKDRTNLINDGIKLGESLHKQKVELEQSIEDELAKTRSQVDKIISDTHQQSRAMLAAAEKDAVKKAELISQDAKKKLERDINLARNKLKTELVGLVSDATEAIIGEKLDQKKDSKLIDKALNGSLKS